MLSNFDKALDKVLEHEGGFSTDERDRGNQLPDGRKGSTMLGVTQANWEAFVGHPVTWNDMKALTRETVKPFYKRLYWDKVHGDDLPEGLDYLMVDFAINAGAGRAVKLLQEAIGTVPDGVIGPKTLAALKAANPVDLIDKFSAAKEAFYKGLKDFPIYGKGWLNRVADVKVQAKTMLT